MSKQAARGDEERKKSLLRLSECCSRVEKGEEEEEEKNASSRVPRISFQSNSTLSNKLVRVTVKRVKRGRKKETKSA